MLWAVMGVPRRTHYTSALIAGLLPGTIQDAWAQIIWGTTFPQSLLPMPSCSAGQTCWGVPSDWIQETLFCGSCPLKHHPPHVRLTSTFVAFQKDLKESPHVVCTTHYILINPLTIFILLTCLVLLMLFICFNWFVYFIFDFTGCFYCTLLRVILCELGGQYEFDN